MALDPSEHDDFWTLFVDGASGGEGAGAGILLVDPDNHEYTYALRFDFRASNNEAEYEALIAGLQLALKLKVQKLKVYSDSQLVVNKILGSYSVNEPVLQRYLDTVLQLSSSFIELLLDRIPRSLNKRADALSNLASSAFAHLTKKVLVEVLSSRSIDNPPLVVSAILPSRPCWMTPLVQYLSSEILPSDRLAAKKLLSYELSKRLVFTGSPGRASDP